MYLSQKKFQLSKDDFRHMFFSSTSYNICRTVTIFFLKSDTLLGQYKAPSGILHLSSPEEQKENRLPHIKDSLFLTYSPKF
jgi:hypothetical protein